MRKTVLCLCLIGCRDEAPEASATKRCETLLAAEELNRLPEKHRADRRAAIWPKDAPLYQRQR